MNTPAAMAVDVARSNTPVLVSTLHATTYSNRKNRPIANTIMRNNSCRTCIFIYVRKSYRYTSWDNDN